MYIAQDIVLLFDTFFSKIIGTDKPRLPMHRITWNFMYNVLTVSKKIDTICVCITLQGALPYYFFYNDCDSQIAASNGRITQKLIFNAFIINSNSLSVCVNLPYGELVYCYIFIIFNLDILWHLLDKITQIFVFAFTRM